MPIKTWHQRCEEHPDHQNGMVTHAMVMARMQEEINELRHALEQCLHQRHNRSYVSHKPR